MIKIIKTIFLDLFLLYKRFLHWNISKFLIFIFGIFLGVLLSLPFIIFLIIIVFVDPIDWKSIMYEYVTTKSIGLSLITALSEYLYYIIIEGILIFLIFGAFVFGYSYKIIPISKLYFLYLKGEKIPYFKNIYFNFQKILSFFGIIFYGSVILFLPFLVFIIYFFISIFAFGGVEKVHKMYLGDLSSNYFGIMLLTVFVITTLIFLYLSYRISFAYLIMLDEENYSKKEKSIFYVKESFKISSGIKIFKFLLIIILFIILMIPFDYIGKILDDDKTTIFDLLYFIFTFMFISGLFEMLIVSIYKNIMYDKEKNILENDLKIEKEIV